MTADIDLKKLCVDSHRISKEKGWLDGPKRPYGAICSLIHSELSEALEDYRANYGVNEVYYQVRGVKVTLTERLNSREPPSSDIGAFKPCGIPIELADAVIRIAQHCGTEGWEIWKVVEDKQAFARREEWGDFEDAVAWMHAFVSRSFMASEGMHMLSLQASAASTTSNGALDELANAYLVIDDYCTSANIDLEKAVLEKQAYNETRGHRHGGKKI